MQPSGQPLTYEAAPSTAQLEAPPAIVPVNHTLGMRQLAHRIVTGPSRIDVVETDADAATDGPSWYGLTVSARVAIRRPNKSYESWSIYEAYCADERDQEQEEQPLFLVRHAFWDNEADLAALLDDEQTLPEHRMSITAQTTDVSNEAASEISRSLKSLDDGVASFARVVDDSVPAGDQFYIYLETNWGWLDLSWSAPVVFRGGIEMIEQVRAMVIGQIDVGHQSNVGKIRFRYEST